MARERYAAGGMTSARGRAPGPSGRPARLCGVWSSLWSCCSLAASVRSDGSKRGRVSGSLRTGSAVQRIIGSERFHRKSLVMRPVALAGASGQHHVADVVGVHVAPLQSKSSAAAGRPGASPGCRGRGRAAREDVVDPRPERRVAPHELAEGSGSRGPGTRIPCPCRGSPPSAPPAGWPREGRTGDAAGAAGALAEADLLGGEARHHDGDARQRLSRSARRPIGLPLELRAADRLHLESASKCSRSTRGPVPRCRSPARRSRARPRGRPCGGAPRRRPRTGEAG